MLWYKAWLESRWKFYIGLALLAGLSVTIVLLQPVALKTLTTAPELGGRLGEIQREGAAMIQTYPGYIWSQWFAKNLPNTWTLLAILIGAGGIVTESSRGSALFTLSLPVSRWRLLAIRAATGAVELAVLAVVPSLLVSMSSPIIGKTYAITDTVLYALLTAVSGMVFFSFSFLLSTLFRDQWKRIMIGVALVIVLGLRSAFIKEFAPYSVFDIMSGQSYFLRGQLPWLGVSLSLVLAALLFYLSLQVVKRRDF